MSILTPGLSAVLTILVSDAHTATTFGCGDMPVFSTPALVALMEAAAVRAIDGQLEPGQTSVGVQINVTHLAATPVGIAVRANAMLTQVDGRTLGFFIEAWDNMEKIGEAYHERILVMKEKFIQKTDSKRMGA